MTVTSGCFCGGGGGGGGVSAGLGMKARDASTQSPTEVETVAAKNKQKKLSKGHRRPLFLTVFYYKVSHFFVCPKLLSKSIYYP